MDQTEREVLAVASGLGSRITGGSHRSEETVVRRLDPVLQRSEMPEDCESQSAVGVLRGSVAAAVASGALGLETPRLGVMASAVGAAFVGMQAFEWTKLIVEEGVRPWGNPLGAPQFGAVFFMITGFHGTHVSIGVVFLIIVAVKVLRGNMDDERPGFMTGKPQRYEMVETMGLYWHFVDLVWVFIFAFFYLW